MTEDSNAPDSDRSDHATDYTPIDCNLYDYVEIACMYRYPVRAATTDGRILTGIASDTMVDADKVEYLELLVDGERDRLRLDRIASFEPLVENARFGKVRF